MNSVISTEIARMKQVVRAFRSLGNLSVILSVKQMTHDVMVADANALGMIAALRSLGRGGYRTHAVASDIQALGFRSRFTFRHAIHPACESSDFIPWLREYVKEFGIGAIVCSEKFLYALGPCYEEFQHLIPDRPRNSVRELCISKIQVDSFLQQSESAGRYIPDSGSLDDEGDIAESQPRWDGESGYYLKLDGNNGIGDDAQSRVVRVASGTMLPEKSRYFLKQYSRVMWQRQVRGLQVGASLWRHEGEICAENMVLGLHLYPWFAGNMSLRKTWWHQALLDDAKKKLHVLDWSGVAMMEYIWDPVRDRFWFIEMNPRYWGYLHLDLSCGKDFPRMQVDAHFGQKSSDMGSPGASRVMRYGPGEVIHLASYWLAKEVSLGQKVRRLFNFLVSSANPKIKADLWFEGDRSLYFISWIRFIGRVPSKFRRALHRWTATDGGPDSKA